MPSSLSIPLARSQCTWQSSRCERVSDVDVRVGSFATGSVHTENRSMSASLRKRPNCCVAAKCREHQCRRRRGVWHAPGCVAACSASSRRLDRRRASHQPRAMAKAKKKKSKRAAKAARMIKVRSRAVRLESPRQKAVERDDISYTPKAGWLLAHNSVRPPPSTRATARTASAGSGCRPSGSGSCAAVRLRLAAGPRAALLQVSRVISRRGPRLMARAESQATLTSRRFFPSRGRTVLLLR